MKQEIIRIAIFIIVIGIVVAMSKRLRKRKNIHHIPPSSISGGVQYEIPYIKKNFFRLNGVGEKTYTIEDLLLNRINHPDLDYTQVLYDGSDLQSNSMIKYVASPPKKVPKTVNIYLAGSIDPKKVKAHYGGRRDFVYVDGKLEEKKAGYFDDKQKKPYRLSRSTTIPKSLLDDLYKIIPPENISKIENWKDKREIYNKYPDYDSTDVFHGFLIVYEK